MVQDEFRELKKEADITDISKILVYSEENGKLLESFVSRGVNMI